MAWTYSSPYTDNSFLVLRCAGQTTAWFQPPQKSSLFAGKNDGTINPRGRGGAGGVGLGGFACTRTSRASAAETPPLIRGLHVIKASS